MIRNNLTERDLSRIVRRIINEQNKDDSKSHLIKVLTNHLKVMKNSQEWTAMMVAQGIYNDCAHFMNKTSTFSSRPGDALESQAPFAPEE
jgi:hypothetical protein